MAQAELEEAEAVNDLLIDKDNTKKNEDGTRIKYMQRKTLTILLGILNVFLFVILIVIITYYISDKSQRVIIKPAKTFCLPCEEISIHPDDDPANFHKYFVQRQENGKTLCCADDGRNLEKMMELYVERKHAIKTAESSKEELEAACNDKITDFEPRVMARVAGIKETKENGVNHIVHWKLSKSVLDLFFKHNISYDPKTAEFVINQPGYYYIYSQITMSINKEVQNDRDNICHYIYRTRKGLPHKLLQNSRTRCKFQGDESRSTSYIGAVFDMNKDDRLMVKVSHPKVVDKAESSSYYGLHII